MLTGPKAALATHLCDCGPQNFLRGHSSVAQDKRALSLLIRNTVSMGQASSTFRGALRNSAWLLQLQAESSGPGKTCGPTNRKKNSSLDWGEHTTAGRLVCPPLKLVALVS